MSMRKKGGVGGGASGRAGGNRRGADGRCGAGGRCGGGCSHRTRAHPRRTGGSHRASGPRRAGGRRGASGHRRGGGATQTRGRINRRDVADRLHSAAIHLLRTVRKTDTATGITPARLSALSVLVFAGPRSLRELADAEQVTAPTMSRIVAGLESEGYVRRRPDRHDQRSIQIRSTARGNAALERGRRLRIESLVKLLRSASKDELATLSRAARLIEEAIAAQ